MQVRRDSNAELNSLERGDVDSVVKASVSGAQITGKKS